MTRIAQRLSVLENLISRIDSSAVIAFMVDGASDDDVIAISYLGNTVTRADGETLTAMVERAKATQPLARHHVLFFEYPDALRQRLGKDYLPETLPNTWPLPSVYGCARHVEQVQ